MYIKLLKGNVMYLAYLSNKCYTQSVQTCLQPPCTFVIHALVALVKQTFSEQLFNI